MKYAPATCASEMPHSSDLLLHELKPTNQDYPSSASSTLCPKIWVQQRAELA
jgi:hypothetical protein